MTLNKNFNHGFSEPLGNSSNLQNPNILIQQSASHNDYDLGENKGTDKTSLNLHDKPLSNSGSDVQSKSPQRTLQAHFDDLVFLVKIPYSKPPSQPLIGSLGWESFVGKNAFKPVSEKRPPCGTDIREVIFRNPQGVEIEQLYSPDKDFEADCTYRYTLPGSYLKSLPLQKLYHALKTLLATPDVKFTRVDLAVDVYNDPRLLKRFLTAYESGNFTGFKKGSIHNSDSFQKGQRVSEGLTVYFGRRESDKLIRVYDKALQLGEGNDHVRYELELRNDNAHNAIKEIIDNYPIDNLEYGIAVLATSDKYIDFIDRSKNKQPCRCPRLKWWNKLLADVKSLNKLYICKQ
ncbi:putative phage replication protein RstA [Nostoc sp. PCC 7524]|uniref:replication initiation factor domain-containing protein n=1 Tax=Nostoc sp. (strain ATCC 29411 / PCC 7524) TaxID=28072 RepID=UPI00029F3901|nr:replication initiation factor domain-containing protein [Nostoc sp. PCC 7524]AFY47096.1 putative phage replication protein RstA [Nostoc sp. PCC 7524]